MPDEAESKAAIKDMNNIFPVDELLEWIEFFFSDNEGKLLKLTNELEHHAVRTRQLTPIELTLV